MIVGQWAECAQVIIDLRMQSLTAPEIEAVIDSLARLCGLDSEMVEQAALGRSGDLEAMGRARFLARHNYPLSTSSTRTPTGFVCACSQDGRGRAASAIADAENLEEGVGPAVWKRPYGLGRDDVLAALVDAAGRCGGHAVWKLRRETENAWRYNSQAWEARIFGILEWSDLQEAGYDAGVSAALTILFGHPAWRTGVASVLPVGMKAAFGMVD